MSPLELSFTPVDNQRPATLCGALDENLRQIETGLDVNIARRGEHFSVSGKPTQTRLATKLLQRFYDQASGDLTLEDVQLAHARLDLGDELDGGGAGADHGHALAGQVVLVVPLRGVEGGALEGLQAPDGRQ